MTVEFSQRSGTVRGSAAIGVLVAALVVPALAAAQENVQAEAAGAVASQNQVEEIVVSARRRAELLEDTPIAVTALGPKSLEVGNVSRIEDIQQLVPNLVFQSDNTGQQKNIRIRGVGTSAQAIAFDPGVGVYLDGVFLPRALGQLLDIVDVQQIEVLRGPQGTLFGKNTVGGAINITTVKPHDEFEGSIMIRPGNFDQIDTRAVLNIPIWEDVLAMRLAVGTTNNGGYVEHVDGGKDRNDRRSVAFLGSIRFRPTEDFTFDVAGSWSRDHNHGVGAQCVVVNRDVPLLSLLPDGYFEDCERSRPYENNSDTDALSDTESYGTWGVAQYDVGEIGFLDDLSFKMLGSWREQRPRVRFDVDNTSFTAVQLSSAGRGDAGSLLDGPPGFQRQVSSEFQMNGQALDGKLNFVTGIFGFWEHGTDARTTYVLPGSLNRLTNALTEIDNWTWALFGQATLDATDWLSITGGIRYTEDKKELRIAQTDPNFPDDPAIADETGQRIFTSWTPMASVALTMPDELLGGAPVDHLMTYFTYSRGFKGGGFNGVATGRGGTGSEEDFSFQPETLDNFEVGLKTIAFDNRLTFNFAFFQGKYDDIQLTQVRDNGFDENGVPQILRLTFNAAEATTQGFEIEMNARPIEGMLIQANVGHTDANYDSFVGSPSDLDGAAEVDRSGTRFLFVPKWQTTLGVQQSFPVHTFGFEGVITPRLDWVFQSDVHWLGQEVAAARQPSFHKLNGRLTYSFLEGQASVALWVRNLTDEETFSNVTPVITTFGVATRQFDPPRTFGAELRYSF